jgi:hypothetical protein
LEDFSGGGRPVSDRSRWSGDLAWFYQPTFLSKTSLGLGASVGEESVDLASDRSFFTPSLRARWNATEKTQIGGFVGVDFREFDLAEGGTRDSTTPVFGIDSTWQMLHQTSVGLSLSRSVDGSVVELGEDIASTRVGLTVRQGLGDTRSASMYYNYEFADYEANGSAASSGRRENYHQLGISLDQNIRIHSSLNATLGVFYNYNRNAAATQEFEFTQHLTGVRIGLAF